MITVKRSYDIIGIYNAIKTCFDDIVEDDTSHDSIEFSVHKECWLEFRLGEVAIGYMQFKPYNRTSLDIHPYILPEFRRYSKQCGKLSLNWFNEQAPSMYQKLISQVPSCHKHIKRYTLSLGFDLEGTHKKAFKKGGELIDLWLFGYERINNVDN